MNRLWYTTTTRSRGKKGGEETRKSRFRESPVNESPSLIGSTCRNFQLRSYERTREHERSRAIYRIKIYTIMVYHFQRLRSRSNRGLSRRFPPPSPLESVSTVCTYIYIYIHTFIHSQAITGSVHLYFFVQGKANNSRGRGLRLYG